MSLIDSIFGATASSAKQKKEERGHNPTVGAVEDLFSTSTSLPEPPVYTYATSSRRSQQKETAKKSKKRKIAATEEKGEEDNANTSIHAESAPSQEPKENDDARTVFVGNLPAACTRKQLKHLFSDCGPIHSTRIRCVPLPAEETNIKLPPTLAGQQHVYKKVCINTSASSTAVKKESASPPVSSSSVIGYVVFVDAASVESALRKHNLLISDTTLEPLSAAWKGKGARHLRVDRVGGETQLRDPQRTVFLGNLPYRTDEETLHQHIVQHMEEGSSDMIENIRIVRDKETYLCKGFAYVLFTSTQYVPKALRQLHQTTYMKQPIRIQVCGKRTKTSSKPKSGSAPSPSKGSTSTEAPSTAAVGALRRVLKKAQTALLPAPKTKVRKRGPTAGKAAAATKKTTPKKRQSTAQQRGKRLQHKIERHIQSQRRRPPQRG